MSVDTFRKSTFIQMDEFESYIKMELYLLCKNNLDLKVIMGGTILPYLMPKLSFFPFYEIMGKNVHPINSAPSISNPEVTLTSEGILSKTSFVTRIQWPHFKYLTS